MYMYVTRSDAAPVKKEYISIINEVQDLLRNDFTFQYRFIGSSSRNMITQDKGSNIGFDFDVNLSINDPEEKYSAEEIKRMIFKALQTVSERHFGGLNTRCEDSTRVITLKYTDSRRSRIVHSCDFAIVYDYTDRQGNRRQQYIHYNKTQRNWMWQDLPNNDYLLNEKAEQIKSCGYWNDVRELYLIKKNENTDPNKHSRSLYAETINEIYMRCR